MSASETLLETAKELRALAAGIAARSFHLYFVGGAATRRLELCLDSAFPAETGESANLLDRLPWRFADIVADASHPFWWGKVPPGDFSQLFCETIPAEDGGGLILPLSGERHRPGVAFFLGPELQVDAPALLDLHGRCLALFNGLAERDSGVVETALPTISKRELQCLRLTANGLTSEDIAKRLGLSVHTANQYLASTTQKLDAVNRVHAVAKALRAGLID